jgi:ribokinase
MKARILIVGYLSIDEIETPQGRFSPVPGGAALYAALGARHAGAQAAICAQVGQDYPPAWLDTLSGLGIDISHVLSRPGPSRTASISHGRDGARRSALHAQASWWRRTEALAPVLPRALEDIAMIVACPMPLARLAAVLDSAQARRIPVVADTSEAFAGASGAAFLELLPRLAVFAPSREETQLILPGIGDDEAAITLAALGTDLLQKRGADGAYAVAAHASQGVRIAAPAGGVVRDPTGAGDSVVGALAAHLAAGRPFLEAVVPALSTGSLTVAGIGPSALGFASAAAEIELRPA